MVSPSLGSVSTYVMRSMLLEPTTTTAGAGAGADMMGHNVKPQGTVEAERFGLHRIACISPAFCGCVRVYSWAARMCVWLGMRALFVICLSNQCSRFPTT